MSFVMDLDYSDNKIIGCVKVRLSIVMQFQNKYLYINALFTIKKTQALIDMLYRNFLKKR